MIIQAKEKFVKYMLLLIYWTKVASKTRKKFGEMMCKNQKYYKSSLIKTSQSETCT